MINKEVPSRPHKTPQSTGLDYSSIAFDGTLNDGGIVGPPDKNRSIGRFGKGACKDQLPTPMGFPSER